MNNLMKRIMSVAMAAITTTSPILSSYTIYASDITVSYMEVSKDQVTKLINKQI